MKKRKIGNDLVGELGLGCMGMSYAYGTPDEAESLKTLCRALELGVNLWDTADMYGPLANEELLAKALGGEVGLARAPEVGFGTVDLNALGLGHPMMRGLPPSFKVMQWHHAEVTRVPAGAEVLASSQVSPVQIMSVGQDILATQFHGELTPALIDRWAHIPQYLEWLEQAMGPKAYDRVKAQSKPQMPKIERMGRIMFRNLIANRRSARTAAGTCET